MNHITICVHLLVRILNNHTEHVMSLCLKVGVFKILICRFGGLQPPPCVYAMFVCHRMQLSSFHL